MPSVAESRLRRRARQYLDGGQMVAAQTTLESLAQRVPDDVAVRMQLADVLLARGNVQAATRQLLDAASRLDADATGASEIAQLARSLYLTGETVAARDCFGHPRALHAQSADELVALVRARSLLDEPPATLALMQRALAAGADEPDEHFTHALLLQYTGRIDEAAAKLETCMARWPTFGGAAMTLMQLRRQDSTGHLDALRRHVAHIPADNIVHAEFQFALFKLLDDLGRHDEAWQALEAGNRVTHALQPYDATGEAAAATAVIDQSEAMAASPPPAPAAASAGPTPIFVVGMPRSGTTLLERMLSNHSQVAAAGELSDFVRQLRQASNTPGLGLDGLPALVARSSGVDLSALGARYLEQTRWRAGERRFYVDKLPNNFLLLHLIHRALPHAPIVHMTREPMAVCFSNFKAMFGQVSAYSYDMQALAHYHGQYRRVMDHWRRTLPRVVLDVPYADLVRDPADSLRRVLKHCGLELEDACLHPARNSAPVSTPSSAQVREPVHTRGLDDWRRYAARLEPLRQALGG